MLLNLLVDLLSLSQSKGCSPESKSQPPRHLAVSSLLAHDLLVVSYLCALSLSLSLTPRPNYQNSFQPLLPVLEQEKPPSVLSHVKAETGSYYFSKNLFSL